MCTAITYQTKDHYFGRNLDLEYSYQEEVTVTPRNFPLAFYNKNTISHHFALIGVATIANNYPLYYDATNEYGLSMAGLNFPGNAVYYPLSKTQVNIAPYSFIPWILCRCKNINDAKALLESTNLADIPFSREYPQTPLHWIISDQTGSITVEPMVTGLKIYKNAIGVLTNNPPFDFHINNLTNYLNLTNLEPQNPYHSQIELTPQSRGTGGMGLPGDLSSPSRFIRASFTKLNSVSGDSELESISQFFHILDSVKQQAGCVKINGGYEKTVYSSCCNMDKGVYYYKTYENNQINAIDLFQENPDGENLIHYPLIRRQEINYIN